MPGKKYLLKVRDKPALVIALMRALAGDASISFAGHVSGSSFSAMAGAVVTKHTEYPWDVVRLPLEVGTIRPIWDVLSGECRVGHEVWEIRIVKDGQEEFIF